MDIVAFDKLTGSVNAVRNNDNTIFTTNKLLDLVDVSNNISYTNKNYVYYDGTSNLFSSNSLKIGAVGIATSFADMTAIGSGLVASTKIRYNSLTNLFYTIVRNYSTYRYISIMGTTGKTAFNTNAELVVKDLLLTNTLSNGSGISFGSTTGIFTMVTTMPKLYYIKYYVFMPFDSLAVNSRCIIRLRQNNITGTILSESSSYISLGTNSFISNCISLICYNPVNIVPTIQLQSGVYTLSTSRNSHIYITIKEI